MKNKNRNDKFKANVESVSGEDATLRIKETAERLLMRREHSRSQLKTKLLQRGFLLPQIENVLDELAAKNLQSDERFTENYIRWRSEKGYGPLRIAEELKHSGVEESILQNHLDMYDKSWKHRARIAMLKRFTERSLADLKTRAQCMRFLQYRGFSFDHIKEVINDHDDE